MSETIPIEAATSRADVVAYLEKQDSAPIHVERRVPWVTSGAVGRDSAGYSVLKAAAFALGYIGPDQAKEEVHVHQQLRELYQSYGFAPHCGHQAFLVPLASEHLPAFEPRGEKIRAEVRAKMIVDAAKFDPEEAAWLLRRTGVKTKSLGTISDIAGGSLVGFPALGELIELQRNLEVFANAGAQEIALPPNGRIQFPKQTGGSTAYWVGESTSVTESQPSTGSLDLQAKKLGVLVRLNNELLRFASPSAEGLIRLDMARSAALKSDLAMLEGTGGTQIKGLLTYPDIGTHTAKTTGADGDTFEPEDVALMESKLPDAVAGPTAWVMRKQMFAALTNRRADAVSAADHKGPFVFHPTRTAGDPPPMELFGTRVVRSSQVSNAREKGDGSDLTYILLGYFPDWVTARLGVMEFLASGLGETALVNDQTVLRGIQHLDAGPRHAASFVICDTLVVA
jgi:HK97 family phage major capsid protein